MSKFVRFTLPVLAAFVLVGLYSASVYAAGPAPKIVVPLEKSFYLTPTLYDGNEALSACAPGYHFASVFEIRELASLSYNTDLGRTSDDSGSGPPASEVGWVRSGKVDHGAGNCHTWTSENKLDLGTIGSLSLSETFLGKLPWEYGFLSCDSTLGVWCLSDSEY